MTKITGNQAVWKQRIVRSLDASKRQAESKYFQLATVDLDGKPAVRTVVFRGFSESKDSIYAITDIRSDKYLQLKSNPHAQICWYFARSREQYRFSCTVELVESGPEYRERWQGLSKNTQNSFNSPVPKAPIGDDTELTLTYDGPLNFALLKFNINECDYLDLKSTPQFRELESLINNEWHAIAVNA